MPFEKPVVFPDIPDSIIDTVAMYQNVVLKRSSGTNHQDIDVKKVLANARNMFRDGVKYNDDLWPQHVSISIREIIGFIKFDGEDFHLAHSSIPQYAVDQGIKEQMDNLTIMRSYLSDIVHCVPGNRLGMMHKLYPSDGYGTMRPEKFFREEEKTLEKVCIDLVYILHDIFTTYCVGKIEQPPEVITATTI